MDSVSSLDDSTLQRTKNRIVHFLTDQEEAKFCLVDEQLDLGTQQQLQEMFADIAVLQFEEKNNKFALECACYQTKIYVTLNKPELTSSRRPSLLQRLLRHRKSSKLNVGLNSFVE